MKTFCNLFCILFVFTNSVFPQEPTNASLPDSSHVLVVYNSNSGISDSIMNYYKDARGIPALNIVPLNLLDFITITNEQGIEHDIQLKQSREIIVDLDNEFIPTPTDHAWIYFNDEIVIPIKDHLVSNSVNGTPLKDIIRYIVICPDVPFKIQAREDSGSPSTARDNTAIDGMLTMLSKSFGDLEFFLSLYNNPIQFNNPFFQVDQCYSMEYRFLPHHFIEGSDTLSYLISRLDGINLEDIQGMIDRSKSPNMSGDKIWVVDNHPNAVGDEDMAETNESLVSIGLNVDYNNNGSPITSTSDSVMAYTSAGVHAGMDPEYIQSQLNFDYANGAVFNTFESFNGNSISTLTRRGQGLIPEFILMGGTGGVSHAYEPGGIVADSAYFTAYALGYNFVDASYIGMPKLARQNVVIGDPLLRIRDYIVDTLTSNQTISTGTYEFGIYVPPGITLTISSGSVIDFEKNAHLKVDGILTIEDNVVLNFRGFSCLLINNDFNIPSNCELNFMHYNRLYVSGDFNLGAVSEINLSKRSLCSIDGSLYLSNNTSINAHDQVKFSVSNSINFYGSANVNFNGVSELTFSDMFVPSVVSVNFKNDTKLISNGNLELNGINITLANLDANQLVIQQGSIINFNSGNEIIIRNLLVSIGNSNNPIIYNFNSPNNKIVNFIGNDNLTLEFCEFNAGDIRIIPDNLIDPVYINITNSTFNNSFVGIYISGGGAETLNAQLVGNTINNCTSVGIFSQSVHQLSIVGNNIIMSSTGSPFDAGIQLFNVGNTTVNSCTLSTSGSNRVGIGIDLLSRFIDGETALNGDLLVTGCYLQDFDMAIQIIQQTELLSSLEVNSSIISDCDQGIIFENTQTIEPIIKDNQIYNYWNFGINIISGDVINIYHNTITGSQSSFGSLVGINLSQVTNPYIVENVISAYGLTEPGSGILLVSCNGEIRKNTIQYHSYGIEFGGSSPNVAENNITDNSYSGLYISSDSNPDLGESFSGGLPYPLTGYNTIRENGDCGLWNNGEIYIYKAYTDLSYGCNTIADDRENDPGLGCDYTILIDGFRPADIIYAEGNYWGDHPEYGHDPEQRFGEELYVEYEPYLEDPCTFGAGGSMLVMTTSQGIVIDTVYSSGPAPSEMTDLESRYSTANEYYYNNMYSEAKQEYQQIVQNYADDIKSVQAYNKLYSIEKIVSSTPEPFNELRTFYLGKLNTVTDSTLIGTLTHLSNLCLVASEEYLGAIDNFDEIVQENPNTDLALYRQIDALTTALLIPPDSTLGKGTLGKYSVSDISEYTNRVNELLKNRGRAGIETTQQEIPEEYFLYQNYPNPFNPVTTIKFDLPEAGNLELVVYDILGRRVRTLQNEKKEAGRYEINWDASDAASGIYIYRLRAGDYVYTKKMILLK